MLPPLAPRPPHAVRPAFPFTAIVGQPELKLALLLNAVSPAIGGVLARGQRGTAKSTAVRALAALLPALEVVEGCAYGCDPRGVGGWCADCATRAAARGGALPVTRRAARLVELPLGATEDRVLGTLDLEHAISEGARRFEPGLLAAAHRGVLYIDEVNLLPDHLIDALLDAAASGVHVVEREGISVSHPAAFVLVGTMNPEEGDLRPQLLDRFGLSVEVSSPDEPAERAEVVRRRLAFEADPLAFAARWAEEERALAARLAAARARLAEVVVDDGLIELIARVCAELGAEGLRADITLYKAAAALAAFEGRTSATAEDVRRTARLALLHRRRRQPFEEPRLEQSEIEDALRQHTATPRHPDGSSEAPPDATAPDASPPDATPADALPPRAGTHPTTDAMPSSDGATPSSDGAMPPHAARAPDTAAPPRSPAGAQPATGATERVIAPGAALAPPLPQPRGAPHDIRAIHPPRTSARATGRGRAIPDARGAQRGARPPLGRPTALALGATLRAAAPPQPRRRSRRGVADRRVLLERWDLREPVRTRQRGALILFVVDASGSMAARRRMAAAKGAVLALLRRAYQARDRVALAQFRGTEATLVLPPTRGADLASRALTALPTGGRTPLAAALRLAERTLRREAGRGAPERALLVVLTDGRANVALPPARAGWPLGDPLREALVAAADLRALGVPALVVDAEAGQPRLGLARALGDALGGRYVELAALEPAALTAVVRAALGRQAP